MAIVIVATAGAANANSFLTLARTEEIIETRLHKAEWTAATAAEKNAVLVWATDLLASSFIWNGAKTATTQSLPFPRTGIYNRENEELSSLTIPTDIERATAELALALLKEDRTEDDPMRGFKEMVVSGMRLVSDRSSAKTILPDNVARLVEYLGEYSSGDSINMTIERC